MRVLREEAFEELAGEPGYSWAPFSNVGLGVHHGRRLVVLEQAIGRHQVAEVLHEAGHCFASRKEPDDTPEEFDFLGWEMAAALAIGLPLSAWRDGNRDYQLWGGTDKPSPPWPSMVGACTDQHLEALLQDRLVRARELRLADSEGRPLCVRAARSRCLQAGR